MATSEAGEYQVSLSGPDGDVGGAQKLLLRGDNPPVYRGAMDFTDGQEGDRDEEEEQRPGDSEGRGRRHGEGGGGRAERHIQRDQLGSATTEVAASGDAPSMVPGSAYNKTADEEVVKEHPGGCGCVAAGLEGGTLAGAFAGLLAVGVVVGRRRAVERGRRARDRGPAAEARVTPGEAIAQAKRGALLPVYVVAGEERLLRDEVVRELRTASLAGGLAAFNEDKFTAGEAAVDTVLGAARTVPMMAARRFVLVRGAERWDAGEGDAGSPFDRLAEYVTSPIDSTCLVVVTEKLDGRRKFALVAKKQGFVVSCDPLDDRALPGWIVERFATKGHAIDRDAADLLAALVGPELSPVDDAVERLSLYAGPGASVGEDAIAACVARVRTADTWALVDAVGARDLGRALRTLADAYDPRERGLPLLGALAWSIRQLARYLAALQSGASPDDAARRAGVFQAFRARELAAKAKASPGQGGRAMDARAGRGGSGAEELAPPPRCRAGGHAHPSLPERNARGSDVIQTLNDSGADPARAILHWIKGRQTIGQAAESYLRSQPYRPPRRGTVGEI